MLLEQTDGEINELLPAVGISAIGARYSTLGPCFIAPGARVLRTAPMRRASSAYFKTSGGNPRPAVDGRVEGVSDGIAT